MNLKNLLQDSGKCCLMEYMGKTEAREGRGVAPLLSFYTDYSRSKAGCRIADTVIGKAAASIIILLGADEAYGEVMSRPALEVFKENGVKATFGKLVPVIINRRKDGICPMEAATADTKSPEEALAAIYETLKRLNS